MNQLVKLRKPGVLESLLICRSEKGDRCDNSWNCSRVTAVTLHGRANEWKSEEKISTCWPLPSITNLKSSWVKSLQVCETQRDEQVNFERNWHILNNGVFRRISIDGFAVNVSLFIRGMEEKEGLQEKSTPPQDQIVAVIGNLLIDREEEDNFV